MILVSSPRAAISCRLSSIFSSRRASPPIPNERRIQLLQKSPEGRLLLEVSALSPLEFVLRELKHPVVQAGLLFFNGLREVDLRCAVSAITWPRCWQAPGKRKCAWAGRPRWPTRLSQP